eukprot:c14222_g1_i2.p1 GENE.c14222_g1_i2~~c14222_g1_i2.p1  ORF type:complete len:294 (+),score=115.08 c14222_g1_i2:60-941(+)
MNNESSIIDAAKKKIEQGDAYEAEQLFKVASARMCSHNDYDGARKLLISGSKEMILSGNGSCASALAEMSVKVCVNGKISENESTLNDFIDLIKSFPEGVDLSHLYFFGQILEWSGTTGKHKKGNPKLHDVIAPHFERKKKYGIAAVHYAQGTDALKYLQMIVIYSKDVYSTERDLLLCRAVFHYLVIRKVPEATTLFLNAMQNHGEVFGISPLIRFTNFLLQAINKKESVGIFKLLKQKYEPSIQRDPALVQMLNVIGTNYFASTQGNPMFQNMLRNMMTAMTQGQGMPQLP